LSVYGLAGPVGRRRKAEPPVHVTVVLTTGECVVLPSQTALAKAMGQVARLLAHW
jgi:hypothetical protein